MMKTMFAITGFLLLLQANPKLNQDIIYPKAAEVSIGNGETCEVISEKDMLAAKDILYDYWKNNLTDSSTLWSQYNRQYMTYNSLRMGKVVHVNGACLEKPADFFQKTWCLGMAAAPCYYTAYVNLKDRKVVLFKFNTYDKK